MPNTDLYVIAAGNGSRISANIPKALIHIADEPCLTTTLTQFAHKFRKTFVVTNLLAQGHWQVYFQNLCHTYPELSRLVVNVPIESGRGDGHAVLMGLLAAAETDRQLSQQVVIAWGDVFFVSTEIIDELLSSSPNGSGLIPAVLERDPYVSLLVDDDMRCVAAEFSKYGERRAEGLHDQSVFRFDLSSLKNALTRLHNALWKRDRYITPGGELSLLYSFHQLYNSADPVYVYETIFFTRTFNTPNEVSLIKRDIEAGRIAVAPRSRLAEGATGGSNDA